jgi:hypothetical protein
MKNFLLVTAGLLSLLIGTAPALSQGCSRTWRGAELHIEGYTSLFTDPDQAENRGSEIEFVPEGSRLELVRTPSICNQVLHRAIPYLRAHNSVWREHREGDWEMALYRVGPYYSLNLTMYPNGKSEPQPGVVMPFTGVTAPRMVFRVSDLSLVTVINN